VFTIDYKRGDGYLIDNSVPESHLHPIPLTPDILQSAGFKYKKCGISGADMWQGMDFWGNENMNLRGNVSTARGGTLHLEAYWNTQIYYVHQLQNLYKALTNNELTINLTK
jgi:hypothetical protein